MEKKRDKTQKEEVIPDKRPELEKKLDPVNVAESKRVEWEQQQRSEN